MGLHFLPNAQLVKAKVFSGQPFCTISQFSQYVTRVDQLPGAEQKKVHDAAECVIKSFLKPASNGGIVVAIGIRGHADQDLLKNGQARLAFEQKVSEERAKEVAAALTKEIKARSFRLVAGKLLLTGDPFEPVIEGMGARMLLKNHPANEYERSLNRRVEIFLLRDSTSLAQMADFDLPAQKSFKGRA
jgi:hypothetical protein